MERSLGEVIESDKCAEGLKIAENCSGYYLLCYAEPSMAFSSLKNAFEIGLEMLKANWYLHRQ